VASDVKQNNSAAGAFVVPEAMIPVTPQDLAPLELNKPQALDRLNHLVDVQIRASRSPEGAKRLTLMLSPEGMGRLRIVAESGAAKVRVRLQVEQLDSAKALEALLPQLEARLAAQMAMPVEFELVHEDALGADADLLEDPDFEQQAQDQHESNNASDSDRVEEWSSALEEPILDRGQSLHVVV
jgi:flagellar hook-length control protein FliK